MVAGEEGAHKAVRLSSPLVGAGGFCCCGCGCGCGGNGKAMKRADGAAPADGSGVVAAVVGRHGNDASDCGGEAHDVPTGSRGSGGGGGGSGMGQTGRCAGHWSWVPVWW